MLGVVTLMFIASRYIQGNEAIDVYFILRIITVAISLGLITAAAKNLSLSGKKIIANEFLDEIYPESKA